ncbi:MAG: hypothetical protein AAFV88_11665 [Planctomycetota bacterium]
MSKAKMKIVEWASTAVMTALFVGLTVVSFRSRNSAAKLRQHQETTEDHSEEIERFGKWMKTTDQKLERLFNELREARKEFRGSRFTRDDADSLIKENQLVDPKKMGLEQKPQAHSVIAKE